MLVLFAHVRECVHGAVCVRARMERRIRLVVARAARQAYLLTPEKTPAEEVVSFFSAGLSMIVPGFGVSISVSDGFHVSSVGSACRG